MDTNPKRHGFFWVFSVVLIHGLLNSNAGANCGQGIAETGNDAISGVFRFLAMSTESYFFVGFVGVAYRSTRSVIIMVI